MSKALKYTFLLHALIAILVGAPLLAAPGRFLELFGWAPVDPLLDRVLGAALLGLAWSSFRGWRAVDKEKVAFLIELEAVFCVLSCLGLLRHLLIAYYPLMVWVLFAVFVIFAAAWLFFWFGKPKASK